eukprot:6471089-Amphidinium_carterae.1
MSSTHDGHSSRDWDEPPGPVERVCESTAFQVSKAPPCNMGEKGSKSRVAFCPLLDSLAGAVCSAVTSASATHARGIVASESRSLAKCKRYSYEGCRTMALGLMIA